MINYINCWNLTARNKLISEKIDDIDLIITKEQNIKKIILIQKELYRNDLYELENTADFIDLYFNKFFKYITSLEKLTFDIPNDFLLKRDYRFELKVWDYIKIDEIIKKLNDFWYVFRDFLEWWDFKKNWDTLNIKIKTKEISISFFWDIIDEILIIDRHNIDKIDKVNIWKLTLLNSFKKNQNFKAKDILKNFKILLDNLDLEPLYNEIKNLWYINFDLLKQEKKQINLEIKDIYIKNLMELKDILKKEKNITIITKNTIPISNFVEYNNITWIKILQTNLHFLKSYKKKDEVCICDDNIWKIFVKKRIKRKISQDLDLILQIKPGDFVVHKDHWIWVFRQITKKTIWQITKEYIEIEYDWNDKLFVPITEVERISKYIWQENPKINSLWKTLWKQKLEKAKKDVENIANELLEIYAKRKIRKWFSFFIDKEKIRDFSDNFKYIHTQDQIKAIEEVLNDMSKPYPMDRILIWDVWFWKTEVAFHAIYTAFLNKKQTIFISPLVVLAYEHLSSAKERFKNFPLKIEILTRLENDKNEKEIIQKLKNGDIDLIIWTHKLLSKNIKYKNLWLLIIDEEHKFWVEEKEKIKKMFVDIDILSMSATPIPRSLNMALSWIKEVSILQTPPSKRKWVETYISNKTDDIIKNACLNEFARWWQVFFIHNEVQTIEKEKEYLQKILPESKIIITHWQLPWNELEKRIIDFKMKKYDILLSSTVIENGINFENVNSIIINNAYKFWISQIHQLRWRVWRGDKKWYCYLLFDRKKLNEEQAKRLSTIAEYTHLWAWFELAVRDLEIRWWWEILWIKQSWISQEIWINLYLKMLEEKIEELKNKKNEKEEIKKTIKTEIDLNIWAFLNDDFFASELDKINFYKELEYISDLSELYELKNNFLNIEKNIRKENLNLFLLLETRIKANDYKISKIKRNWVVYEIIFNDETTVDDLKNFLVLDFNYIFTVVDLKKIKTPCSKFKDDLEFLEFINSLFKNKKQNKVKIKLKK